MKKTPESEEVKLVGGPADGRMVVIEKGLHELRCQKPRVPNHSIHQSPVNPAEDFKELVYRRAPEYETSIFVFAGET